MDKAVTDAQKAVGGALLSALGPLADTLGLRPSGKPKISSGQVRTWTKCGEYLNAQRLKSVTPEQARALMERGWVLLDVSPAEDFAEFHAVGSVSTPSVRYGAEEGLRGALRSVAFASLAVKPTEDCVDSFLEAARDALGGSAEGAIVACAAGGTLRPTANCASRCVRERCLQYNALTLLLVRAVPNGQASRSLFAAEALLAKAGLDPGRVVHLRGGLSAWFAAGNPGEGDEEAWNARKGRTPAVGGPAWDQDAPELL